MRKDSKSEKSTEDLSCLKNEKEEMGVLSNGCCTLPVSPPSLQVVCVANGHCHGHSHSHGDRAVTVPSLSSSSSSSSSSTDLEEEEEEEDEGLSDMVESVKVVLQSLGEDIRRDGLIKTPLRVARAFHFATKGNNNNSTCLTFFSAMHIFLYFRVFSPASNLKKHSSSF
mgnify:CR=1 FL=1